MWVRKLRHREWVTPTRALGLRRAVCFRGPSPQPCARLLLGGIGEADFQTNSEVSALLPTSTDPYGSVYGTHDHTLSGLEHLPSMVLDLEVLMSRRWQGCPHSGGF